MRRVRVLGVVLLTVTAVSSCGVLGDDQPAPRQPRAGAASQPAASPSPSVDPDAPSGWGPTLGELQRAEALVDGMSDRERVATVLMPGFWGYDGDRPTPAEAAQNQVMHDADSPVEVAGTVGYGGFFLRPEVISDADQVARLTRQLHDAGDGADGLPLLLSMDQEGGVVQRLAVGVDPVPSALSVGATGDLSYARAVARENGRTLRRLGLTMVLAPVADVDPDGVSVMGSRAYSTDTDAASKMVVATVEGYLQAGVVPVVKHFPGLGTVSGDSHRSLPVQQKSVAELERSDLVPFAAAVEAGAPVVMTAHVAVPALDKGVPASLSPVVVGELLRDRLGFRGVVITDSQGMGPVHGPYGPADGAIRSLLAGNDLVLNSPKPQWARKAVLRALRDGRIPQERVAAAATRVTALRLYQQRLAEGG